MNGRSPIPAADRSRPEWFAALLDDRGARKPSAHTMKAYRQDFDAIAVLVVGGGEDLSSLSLGHLTTEAMRSAFAQYAEHKAASLQRCWSTWNDLAFTETIGSEISLHSCHLASSGGAAPIFSKY